MSDLEPGMTLGRLVAAERNARTSIDVGNKAKAEVDQLRTRLGRLEGQILALQQAVDALRIAQYSNMGSGPTA